MSNSNSENIQDIAQECLIKMANLNSKFLNFELHTNQKIEALSSFNEEIKLKSQDQIDINQIATQVQQSMNSINSIEREIDLIKVQKKRIIDDHKVFATQYQSDLKIIMDQLKNNQQLQISQNIQQIQSDFKQLQLQHNDLSLKHSLLEQYADPFKDQIKKLSDDIFRMDKLQINLTTQLVNQNSFVSKIQDKMQEDLQSIESKLKVSLSSKVNTDDFIRFKNDARKFGLQQEIDQIQANIKLNHPKFDKLILDLNKKVDENMQEQAVIKSNFANLDQQLLTKSSKFDVEALAIKVSQKLETSVYNKNNKVQNQTLQSITEQLSNNYDLVSSIVQLNFKDYVQKNCFNVQELIEQNVFKKMEQSVKEQFMILNENISKKVDYDIIPELLNKIDNKNGVNEYKQISIKLYELIKQIKIIQKFLITYSKYYHGPEETLNVKQSYKQVMENLFQQLEKLTTVELPILKQFKSDQSVNSLITIEQNDDNVLMGKKKHSTFMQNARYQSLHESNNNSYSFKKKSKLNFSKRSSGNQLNLD